MPEHFFITSFILMLMPVKIGEPVREADVYSVKLIVAGCSLICGVASCHRRVLEVFIGQKCVSPTHKIKMCFNSQK